MKSETQNTKDESNSKSESKNTRLSESKRTSAFFRISDFGFRIFSNPWPFAIVAFFAAAVAGCIGFVIFCNRHPTDLVSADYYEQEIQYQNQLERLDRTQRLSSQATVGYEPASHWLTIHLPPAQARHAVTGSIQLYRPSAAGLDRKLKLNVDSSGTQHLDASDLSPGLWKIRLSWTVESQDYFTDQQVVIGGAS
jgi:hypothetical protein